MYQKPVVTRYGTFRDLTLAGFSGTTDGVTFYGAGRMGLTDGGGSPAVVQTARS